MMAAKKAQPRKPPARRRGTSKPLSVTEFLRVAETAYKPPVGLDRVIAMRKALAEHAIGTKAMTSEMADEIDAALRVFYDQMIDERFAKVREATGRRLPKVDRIDLERAAIVSQLIVASKAHGDGFTVAEAVQAIYRCRSDQLESAIRNYRNHCAALPTAHPAVAPNLKHALRAYQLILRIRHMGVPRILRMAAPRKAKRK